MTPRGQVVCSGGHRARGLLLLRLHCGVAWAFQSDGRWPPLYALSQARRSRLRVLPLLLRHGGQKL